MSQARLCTSFQGFQRFSVLVFFRLKICLWSELGLYFKIRELFHTGFPSKGNNSSLKHQPAISEPLATSSSHSQLILYLTISELLTETLPQFSLSPLSSLWFQILAESKVLFYCHVHGFNCQNRIIPVPKETQMSNWVFFFHCHFVWLLYTN